MSLDGKYLTVCRDGMVDIKVPCVKKAQRNVGVRYADNVERVSE